MFYPWVKGQIHDNPFVMIDANGSELTGLTVSAFIRKPGGSFAEADGTVTELSAGWYSYSNDPGESDTAGPVALYFTATGAKQQNMICVVETIQSNIVEHTYTVLNLINDPIPGVLVQISTDLAGTNVIWRGNTDSLGVARDDNNLLPMLQAGTYYFWSSKSGYTFTNPDTEAVA